MSDPPGKPPGARETRTLELLWPGKYDADGRRTPTPRCRPKLAGDCVVPSATAITPQLQFFDGQAAADDPDRPPVHGAADRLVVADNLLALDALCEAAPASVDLIVADPPFSTGGRFDVVTRVGDGPSPPEIRTPAYSDTWHGGAAGLIAMLDPRMRLAHELLAPHGSLYLHVDPTVGHAVKLLLDEVFGPGCFQREIVWRIGWVSGFKTKARNWIRNHDLIFFYVKDPKKFTFNKFYVPYPEGYTRRDGSPPTGKGVPLDDVWNGSDVEHGLRGPESMDSIQIKSFSQEKTGYATQKNESLLRRIIAASSNPGDLVMDPFCGSGTTLAVARALGRRFIGVDTSRAAAQICLRRLVGTPGPPLSIEHVQPAERTALSERGHDWSAWADAEPDGTGATLGARDGRGCVLVDDRVAGPADLDGEAQTEVMAWSWALPVATAPDATGVRTGVPDAFGGSAVALRIERDVLGPHPRPRQGLSPLTCPRLRLLRPGTGVLRIELLGSDEGWPGARDPAAAELPDSGLSLVDGWAVAPVADPAGGAAPSFEFVCFRRHHRRALLDSVELPWPTAALRVRVWDVLHRTTDLVVELSANRQKVDVRRVELQVGLGGSAPTA